MKLMDILKHGKHLNVREISDRVDEIIEALEELKEIMSNAVDLSCDDGECAEGYTICCSYCDERSECSSKCDATQKECPKAI